MTRWRRWRRKMCDKAHSLRRRTRRMLPWQRAPRFSESQEYDSKARDQPLPPDVAAESAAGLHRRDGMRWRISRGLPRLRLAGALQSRGAGAGGRRAGACPAAYRQAPHRRRQRARFSDAERGARWACEPAAFLGTCHGDTGRARRSSRAFEKQSRSRGARILGAQHFLMHAMH